MSPQWTVVETPTEIRVLDESGRVIATLPVGWRETAETIAAAPTMRALLKRTRVRIFAAVSRAGETVAEIDTLVGGKP